ncbi:MAG: dockerin type I repeat-containing protein, partial [Ruminococcus sp.]
NFDESCYNMLAYVAWNESYFAHVSEMDSELASEIYEEVRKCTYAILEVNFIKETEATVTTTAISLPEYTHTYTYTTLPEFVTTTPCVTTTTYTETSRNTGTDNDVPVLYGDANTDGCVDIADVVAVSAYVADSEKNDIGGYGMLCGDVHNTGDGITANDALAIQKFLAGDLSDFC